MGGARRCRRRGTTTSSDRSPPTRAVHLDRLRDLLALRAVITAVASFVGGTVALAAALAAAAVLVLREPRSRAVAMPAALVLALGAVALISGSAISGDVSGRAALVAGAGGGGGGGGGEGWGGGGEPVAWWGVGGWGGGRAGGLGGLTWALPDALRSGAALRRGDASSLTGVVLIRMRRARRRGAQGNL